MENAVLVAQLLAYIAVTAACVLLGIVLVRVKKMSIGIERDVKTLTERTIPVLENIEYITNRIKNVTDSIDDQVMMVAESIGSIREVADNVVELERRVQSRIEGPLLDTVSFIAALAKGIKTFLDRLRS